MADAAPIKYLAFLSYAHADTRAATTFHRALETFTIDRDLIGRTTPMGEVPRTLCPIFRDRDDFSGGHTLGDATITALDASAALIVLCSPIAATQATSSRSQHQPIRGLSPKKEQGPATRPRSGCFGGRRRGHDYCRARQCRSTKLSTTCFWPAFSKSMVSLLPSTAAIVP